MDQHDHRVLGPRLDLFHQQEEAPGAVFWHPRGASLYRIIEDYIRREMRLVGFREVRTPQLLSRLLCIIELGGQGTLAKSLACAAVGGHVALIGALAGFGGDISGAALVSSAYERAREGAFGKVVIRL